MQRFSFLSPSPSTKRDKTAANSITAECAASGREHVCQMPPWFTVILRLFVYLSIENHYVCACGATEGWECRIPRWKWLISVWANEGSQFDSFEFVPWMLLSCVTAMPLSGRHLNSFNKHHLHSLPAPAIIPPCDTFIETQMKSLASCWWKPHFSYKRHRISGWGFSLGSWPNMYYFPII